MLREVTEIEVLVIAVTTWQELLTVSAEEILILQKSNMSIFIRCLL